MASINGYEENDFLPRLSKLSDKQLVTEYFTVTTIIDKGLVDDSYMLDLFIALDTFLPRECMRRLAKRIEEETAAQNP